MEEINIDELVKTGNIDALQKALDTLKSKQIAFDDMGERNKPKATLKNFQQLLTHYGVSIKYNEMSKHYEINIPDQEFHKDVEENAKIAVLRSFAHLHGYPVGEIDNYVIAIGEQNSYHPVRDWIDSQVWDGKDRLQDYYDSVELKELNPMKHVMMRKWALSLVASLYHHDFSCEGVLSLTGNQGLGKTIWVESLLPDHAKNVWNKDAVVIDVKSKDSLTKALQYWIAELGEVDATFRKTDIEALKGFLTEKKDVIRNPYERRANTYQRRTVFYATVNEVEFLQDAQNRRFWVLDIKKLNHGSIDDVGQFWAQMKSIYLAIKDKIKSAKDRERYQEWGWFMSPTERQQMEPLQDKHKMDDPIEEILDKYLEPATVKGEFKSCTEILIECNYGTPKKRDTNICSKWLAKKGYERDSETKKYNVKMKAVLEEKVLNFEKFKKRGIGIA